MRDWGECGGGWGGGGILENENDGQGGLMNWPYRISPLALFADVYFYTSNESLESMRVASVRKPCLFCYQ